MSDQSLRPILLGSIVTVGLIAAASLLWKVAFALGVLAGGLWNLLNLWTLARTLRVWLRGSSRARNVGWFFIKFPLLYLMAIGLLMTPGVSAIGFGMGFSVVLVVAIFASLAQLRRTQRPLSVHGL